MGGHRTLWGRRWVEIGGRRRIVGVGIGGFCGRDGVRNDRGGASRSGVFRGVGGRAGRHRHRRPDCHQALCGDSGQPLPRHDPWRHPATPLPALVAPRISAARLAGTTNPLHGAYRSRGRPESPARPSRCPNRLWRCRPARPPTSRNPALRAAPRCVDPHPSAAPRCVSTHPSCRASTDSRCSDVAPRAALFTARERGPTDGGRSASIIV
jgi:hypothetical protein